MVGDANRFINIFSQRIKDISIQNWRSRLNDSSKAKHYRHFKSLLDIEKYLFTDLTYIARKMLAYFRCSGHNLMIEKSRHPNVEREFSFCPFCLDRNVFSIEDEFFMICPAYDEIRIQYFLPHWRQNITLHHFKLQSDDSIYAVSKFLMRSFSLRNTYYPK